MDEMEKRSGVEQPKASTGAAIRAAAVPTNGSAKPSKPFYTPEFKQRVVRELAALGASGERGAQGAFLRREGLHWPTVNRWQKEGENAELVAFAPKTRGRKPTHDPAADENAKLRRKNAQLEERLRKAELIIDVQKKLAALLGVELPKPDDENS
jgi:transposase-like protein